MKERAECFLRHHKPWVLLGRSLPHEWSWVSHQCDHVNYGWLPLGG